MAQMQSGECLPVCVAMVLEYQQVRYSYSALRRALGVRRNLGVPAYHVHRLRSLNLDVEYRQGSLGKII
jgi:ABC-type bacteriocin/lantibiotic exporter with double-glycine peptidase domain